MQDRSPPTRQNLLAPHGRTIHSGHERHFWLRAILKSQRRPEQCLLSSQVRQNVDEALVARHRVAVLDASKVWQVDRSDSRAIRRRRSLLLCGRSALLRQDGVFRVRPLLTLSYRLRPFFAYGSVSFGNCHFPVLNFLGDDHAIRQDSPHQILIQSKRR